MAAESNILTLPTSGLRDRLKAVAERRYQPQALDMGEFGTVYFRRLTGPEIDTLVQVQGKNEQMSVAEYNSRVAAMALVADEGNALTWQEALELGPAFYNPARDFVWGLTTDYLKRDEKEAEKEADEPAPFLRMPTSSAPSAPNGDGPSSKSTSSPSSPRK